MDFSLDNLINGLLKKNKETINLTTLKAVTYPRVCYVGMEQGDIVMALAKVVMAAGLKVAILDNSLTHDIWTLAKTDPEETTVNRGNLLIVKDGLIDEANNGWDMVIEHLGNRIEDLEMSTAPFQLLVTDSRQNNLNALKAALNSKYEKRLIIYRNTSSSYSLNTLCHEIGFTSEETKKIYTAKFDRHEDEGYAKLTRNINAKFMRNFGAISLPFGDLCRNIFHREIEDAQYISDKQVELLIKKGGKLAV